MKELSPIEIKETKIYREWGLSDTEYNYICNELLHRLPNYTETGLFAVMWSEHCSYKNSKDVLKKFKCEGKQVLQGPGEGAGVVDIGDGLGIAFKIESHNHPSAVEPYEGAATGVGGIIRDIFSMGAKPIAILDSLRFGNLNNEHTKYLLEEVVSGIAGYGNCIGIPTVGGETLFNDCYRNNPLVNAMCVGIIKHEDLQKGKASGKNNSIIYVGAKTGRDGIHGATFASEEFSDSKNANRSAVQVGDPFMEKMLMDACLDVVLNHKDILVGIQDMGAAGLVSSSSEMASKANSGLVLNLDLIPQREENMSAYEMMLSESQERMLLCVKKGHEKEIINLFNEYDLDAVVIGYVSDDKQYKLYHHDECVCDIPVAALVDDVLACHKEYKKPKRLEKFETMGKYVPEKFDIHDIINKMMKSLNICSKSSIYKKYDSQVQTNTVVLPGSDSAVVRIKGSNKMIAMCCDCNSNYLYLDPYNGGKIAVSEAYRNIIASGAYPLAITDCLNYGNPDKPESYYELWTSCDGISEACDKFSTPVVSGNVSLYNETDGKAIFPTPVIGMIGVIENKDLLLSMHLQENDKVLIIGDTKDDFSGSQLQLLLTGKVEGKLMDFSLDDEYKNAEIIKKLNVNHLINSCHDISDGGMIVSLLEACFKNNLGGDFVVDFNAVNLFSETQSRYICGYNEKNEKELIKILNENNINYQILGKCEANVQLKIKCADEVIKLDINEIKKVWEDSLECLMK